MAKTSTATKPTAVTGAFPRPEPPVSMVLKHRNDAPGLVASRDEGGRSSAPASPRVVVLSGPRSPRLGSPLLGSELLARSLGPLHGEHLLGERSRRPPRRVHASGYCWTERRSQECALYTDERQHLVSGLGDERRGIRGVLRVHGHELRSVGEERLPRLA